jgi:hypothetical protein
MTLKELSKIIDQGTKIRRISKPKEIFVWGRMLGLSNKMIQATDWEKAE